jgi:hypothetical protein
MRKTRWRVCLIAFGTLAYGCGGSSDPNGGNSYEPQPDAHKGWCDGPLAGGTFMPPGSTVCYATSGTFQTCDNGNWRDTYKKCS